MKFKRVIAEILAVVLCINTLSISTLAENEAQTFIEVMEQEHIEPVVDQWGVGPASAESGDAALYDAASEDQWAEGEIVAAEAVEGEITEGEAAAENQTTAEGPASAGTGAEGPASAGAALLGDADSKTYSVVDYDGFSKAVDAIVKGQVASSSIVLKSDIDFGSSGQILIQLPDDYQLTINLNGYTIKGSSERLFDINKGTVTFEDEHVEGHKESVDGESTTGVVENVKTGSPAGDIMNIGSGEPTVTIKGGIYRAEDVVINHYKGSFYVNAGDEPQFLTNGTSIFKVTSNSVISLAGGAYNAKFPENVSWVKSGYKAYYSEKAKLYVVMEKHNAYLKGINGAKDKGYDTIEDITEAIRIRGSKDNNTIYLMEDFNAGGKQDISVPTGYSLVFDLYGHELTGTRLLSVEDGASLVLDDSLVGGYLEINNTPVVGEDNLKIKGGSYNLEKLTVTLEQFKERFLDTDHSAVQTEFTSRTAGTHRCFMVTNKTDRILVKNKGSVDDFGAALEIAGPGDEISLIGDFVYDEETGIDGRLEKQIEIRDAQNVIIDLNGHTIEADPSSVKYVFALYGSSVTIKNSRFTEQQSTIRSRFSSGNAIYLEDSATLDISNVNIDATFIAVSLDDDSASTLNATDVTIYGGAFALDINGVGSKMTVGGNSSFIAGGPYSEAQERYPNGNVLVGHGAELKVSDGVYNAILQIENHGYVNLAGGTYNKNILFYQCSSNLDITGGQFNTMFGISYWEPTYHPTFNIRGGFFNKDTFYLIMNLGSEYSKSTKEAIQGAFYVYGGQHKKDIKWFLAPGFYQVKGEESEGYAYTASMGAAIKSHSVIFGNGLYLKVAIMKNPNLRQMVGDDDICIKVTWTSMEGTEPVSVVTRYYFDGAEGHNKFWTFPEEPKKPDDIQYWYVRIPFKPQTMTDTITIEAEARNVYQQPPRVGWGVTVPNQVVTSIRNYTNKNHKGTSVYQTGAMATMLMFGAQAQNYLNYKTDDLADNSSIVTWLTDDVRSTYLKTPVEPGLTPVPDTTSIFIGHSLELAEKYALRLYINKDNLPSDKANHEIAVTYVNIQGGQTTDRYPEAKWLLDEDTNKTYIEIPGIMYTNCPVTYKAVMYEGTEEVANASTSINRCLYDYHMRETGGLEKETKLDSFVKAAYSFGICARDYVENVNVN